MQRPTHTQAIDYALAVERSWGVKHSVTPATAYDDVLYGEVPAVRVVTRQFLGGGNEWHVWFENGEIYGEC